MRIVPPIEQEIRRAIRDERAKKPLITIIELQHNLKRQFNREFSHYYLTKLAEKVSRETLVEIDRAKIEERMAFTRENYRMMREELLKVVYWSPETAQGQRPPRTQDRVEAAKSVVMLDLALLKAEIETGMYKRPIEDLAKTIRYEPLAGEVRLAIIAAWQRGGLLPAATIEEMVPLTLGESDVHISKNS
jgi:hypothetical protein